MGTIGRLLQHRAVEFADRPFCYVGGTGYTFAEMDQRTQALATGLAGQGIRKGDRVALLMPNRIEFIETYFALAKLGAIQVPLNAFLKGDFLRHQLANSRSSVLITDGPGYAAVQPLRAELPDLRLVASLDPANDAIPFEQLCGVHCTPPDV